MVKHGFKWNIVLRRDMHSTVRNNLEKATQHNCIPIQRRGMKTTNTQSFGNLISYMTIIFFKVNGDIFFLRKITYNSATDSLDVRT